MMTVEDISRINGVMTAKCVRFEAENAEQGEGGQGRDRRAIMMFD